MNNTNEIIKGIFILPAIYSLSVAKINAKANPNPHNLEHLREIEDEDNKKDLANDLFEDYFEGCSRTKNGYVHSVTKEDIINFAIRLGHRWIYEKYNNEKYNPKGSKSKL